MFFESSPSLVTTVSERSENEILTTFLPQLTAQMYYSDPADINFYLFFILMQKESLSLL